MHRRELLRLLGAAGSLSAVPAFRGTTNAQEVVRFEAQGAGPALLLGPPFSTGSSVTDGYLERLTDRYRIITVDYPPVGAEAAAVVDSFTADRVCADLLAVADAAGAERFAWVGYSWGGVIGLQLAARTDRLTALVCGGWPPLGAPYDRMSDLSAAAAARAGQPPIFATFYRSLADWPERAAVSQLTCPRMVFAGTDDMVVDIGPLVAEHRDELERMGWTVELVDGVGHELFTRADLVAPRVRAFLDSLELGA